MTFVAGWCDDDAAYLIADTGITTVRQPATPLSSLGQSQSLGGRAVEERSLKIERLGSHFAIGVAGDAELARETAAGFKRTLAQLNGDIKNVPDEWRPPEGTPNAPPNVEFAIATHFEGKPAIVKFDAEGGLKVRPGEGTAFGSGVDSILNDTIRNATRSVHKLATHPHERLVLALAALSADAFTSELRLAQVNGVFAGLCVTATGAAWQPTVLYLPYEHPVGESFTPQHHVRVRFSGDELIVESTLSRTVKRLETLIRSKSQTPLTLPTERDYEYVAFLPQRARGRIIVLPRIEGTKAVVKFSEDKTLLRSDLVENLNLDVVDQARRLCFATEVDLEDFRK